MAKKIQLVSADIKSRAEVIVVNSFLVCRCVRAHMVIDRMLEGQRRPQKIWNDEAAVWEEAKDADGNLKYEYKDIVVDGNELYNEVLPLLEELVNAFKQSEED